MKRSVRADAQRNVDALLEAAKTVFAAAGVDAPVREIAKEAGVGVGTLYRHFPDRAGLIAAVFRREVDACAKAAPELAANRPPFEALADWIQLFAGFITTKRGLASALHSGSSAFEPLPSYFDQHLRPALETLLAAARTAGAVRTDVDADDIIGAVASLCMSTKIDQPDHAHRMVSLFVDGLRYGAQG
ncbi:TetR/AcrR family transcriptional regulator [Roseibium algae]|uniref:TetR family transcriptional regulator n=1 Tax=Roseibium algae TaxID=3123038 RepID=A0ABU8TKY0_9HYPH